MGTVMVHRDPQCLTSKELPVSSRSWLTGKLLFVGLGQGCFDTQKQAKISLPQSANECMQGIARPTVQIICDLFIGFSPLHHFLRRLVGTFDGRARVEGWEVKSRQLNPQLLICPPIKKEAA